MKRKMFGVKDLVSFTALAVIFTATILYIARLPAKEETKPATTPVPTSNIEYRLQQLEQQLADSISKQQELQQGIDRVENQYKNWVRPFEDWFSATQAAYLERYRKRNGG